MDLEEEELINSLRVNPTARAASKAASPRSKSPAPQHSRRSSGRAFASSSVLRPEPQRTGPRSMGAEATARGGGDRATSPRMGEDGHFHLPKAAPVQTYQPAAIEDRSWDAILQDLPDAERQPDATRDRRSSRRGEIQRALGRSSASDTGRVGAHHQGHGSEGHHSRGPVTGGLGLQTPDHLAEQEHRGHTTRRRRSSNMRNLDSDGAPAQQQRLHSGPPSPVPSLNDTQQQVQMGITQNAPLGSSVSLTQTTEHRRRRSTRSEQGATSRSISPQPGGDTGQFTSSRLISGEVSPSLPNRIPRASVRLSAAAAATQQQLQELQGRYKQTVSPSVSPSPGSPHAQPQHPRRRRSSTKTPVKLTHMGGTTEIDRDGGLTVTQASTASASLRHDDAAPVEEGFSPFESWTDASPARGPRRPSTDNPDLGDTITKLDDEMAHAWGWK